MSLIASENGVVEFWSSMDVKIPKTATRDKR
jgi:hypothetical protein